jgi:hypothetical protein
MLSAWKMNSHLSIPHTAPQLVSCACHWLRDHLSRDLLHALQPHRVRKRARSRFSNHGSIVSVLVLVASIASSLIAENGYCAGAGPDSISARVAVDSLSVWLSQRDAITYSRSEIERSTHYLGRIPTQFEHTQVFAYENDLTSDPYGCVLLCDENGSYYGLGIDYRRRLFGTFGEDRAINKMLEREGSRNYTDAEVLDLVFLRFELMRPFASQQYIISSWFGTVNSDVTEIWGGAASADSMKAKYLESIRPFLGNIPDSSLNAISLPRVERVNGGRQVTLYFYQGVVPGVRVLTALFIAGHFAQVDSRPISH